MHIYDKLSKHMTKVGYQQRSHGYNNAQHCNNCSNEPSFLHKRALVHNSFLHRFAVLLLDILCRVYKIYCREHVAVVLIQRRSQLCKFHKVGDFKNLLDRKSVV